MLHAGPGGPRDRKGRGPFDVAWMVPLVPVLLLSLVLMAWNINMPFVGLHEDTAQSFSLAAQNYERFGLVGTRLAPVTRYVPEGSPPATAYYVNHPVLVPLALFFAYKLLGYHHWVARLLPILFSLGTTILLYLMTRRLWGQRVGVLAVFLMALFPMTGIYGKMVSHEAPVLFFVVLSVLFYIVWRQTGQKRILVGFSVALFFGMLTDWPTFYLVPLLALHALMTSSGRARWVLPLFMIFFGLGVLALEVAYIGWVKDGVRELWRLATLRFGNIYTATLGYTPERFLGLMVLRALVYFTPVGMLLAAVWAFWHSGLRLAGLAKGPDSVVALFLGFGMTHILLLRNSAWVHSYWQFHLTPFFALSGALALDRLLAVRRHIALGLVVAFVVLSIGTVAILKVREQNNLWQYQVVTEMATRIRPGQQVVVSPSFPYSLLEYYGQVPTITVYTLEEFCQSIAVEPSVRYAVAFVRRHGASFDEELADYLRERYATQVWQNSFWTMVLADLARQAEMPAQLGLRGEILRRPGVGRMGLFFVLARMYFLLKGWLGAGEI